MLQLECTNKSRKTWINKEPTKCGPAQLRATALPHLLINFVFKPIKQLWIQPVSISAVKKKTVQETSPNTQGCTLPCSLGKYMSTCCVSSLVLGLLLAMNPTGNFFSLFFLMSPTMVISIGRFGMALHIPCISNPPIKMSYATHAFLRVLGKRFCATLQTLFIKVCPYFYRTQT